MAETKIKIIVPVKEEKGDSGSRKETANMETIAVTVEFPKSFLAAAGMREQEVDRWLKESGVVGLYRRGRISLGKATEMLSLPTKWEMTAVLARHDVWFDYTAEDAEQDWETLKEVLSR